MFNIWGSRFVILLADLRTAMESEQMIRHRETVQIIGNFYIKLNHRCNDWIIRCIEWCVWKAQHTYSQSGWSNTKLSFLISLGMNSFISSSSLFHASARHCCMFNVCFMSTIYSWSCLTVCLQSALFRGFGKWKRICERQSTKENRSHRQKPGRQTDTSKIVWRRGNRNNTECVF